MQWPKPWYQVTAGWPVSVGIGLFFIVFCVGGIIAGPGQPTFYIAVLISLPGIFFLLCAILQLIAATRAKGDSPTE
ncbi:hypothetical protein DVJ78_18040 (plasmid) [Humibacter sp. BT305]|nr:hypothetical protein DVJ78_18040 [Humibacter sp. BT305]